MADKWTISDLRSFVEFCEKAEISQRSMEVFWLRRAVRFIERQQQEIEDLKHDVERHQAIVVAELNHG